MKKKEPLLCPSLLVVNQPPARPPQGTRVAGPATLGAKIITTQTQLDAARSSGNTAEIKRLETQLEGLEAQQKTSINGLFRGA